jgi:ADP-ribosylglycohydrolase
MSAHTLGTVLRGVAIGDAWGSPNEFLSIDVLTARDRRGVDAPDFLEVTDDTQMSLYFAKALHDSRGGTVADVQAAIAREFLAYTHDPDFASRAPGNTVTRSLRRLESGLPWQQATDSHSDGCGTVMRVSPAAFTADPIGIAAFSAAITHGTATGIAAAILNAKLVQTICQLDKARCAGDLTQRALQLSQNPEQHGLLDVGGWIDGLQLDLREGFNVLALTLGLTARALDHGYADDPWRADPCLYGGDGWRAHECLATALLAVDAFPDDGWEALRRAVTTNGDSDSIGAVAGGLLGALHGEFWPGDIIERLEPRYRDWIEQADRYILADRQEATA